MEFSKSFICKVLLLLPTVTGLSARPSRLRIGLALVTILAVHVLFSSSIGWINAYNYSADVQSYHLNHLDINSLAFSEQSEVDSQPHTRLRKSVAGAANKTSVTFEFGTSKAFGYIKSDKTLCYDIIKNISNIDQNKIGADMSALCREKIINNFNSNFNINFPATCDKNTKILFVVPSAPGNEYKRRRMRNSELNTFVKNPSNNAKLLFFMGKFPPNIRGYTQEELDKEAKKFKDVVQQDYPDFYRNILTKSVNMLQWAVQNCGGATFVIRVDDDVEFDAEKLAATLKATSRSWRNTNYVLGQIRRGSMVVRSPNSKYYVSREDYRTHMWPAFAVGALQGMPMLTARVLVEAAARTPAVWLDDVFLTGIAGARAGLKLIADPEFGFREIPIKEYDPWLRGKGKE